MPVRPAVFTSLARWRQMSVTFGRKLDIDRLGGHRFLTARVTLAPRRRGPTPKLMPAAVDIRAADVDLQNAHLLLRVQFLAAVSLYSSTEKPLTLAMTFFWIALAQASAAPRAMTVSTPGFCRPTALIMPAFALGDAGRRVAEARRLGVVPLSRDASPGMLISYHSANS